MNRSIALSVLAGLSVSSVALAQNSGVQLNDAPARYEVTSTGATGTIPTTTEPTATAAGVGANFRVQTAAADANANSDHLFSNWWWYRVNGANGSTRELAVRQASGTATQTLLGTNGVRYDFGTQNGLNFSMSYTVVSTGANSAEVRCVLGVTNTSTAGPVDVSLFNYADYFLAGQDANDFATGATVGSNQVVTVTDILRPWATMTHTGFGAAGYLVGGFSAVGGQIADTSIDNFTSNTITNGGATGGDIAGVMQWNLIVDSGQSATVTSIIAVTVPTPGAAAIAGLSGLMAARRRRR